MNKKLSNRRRLTLERTTIALLAPGRLAEAQGGFSAPGVTDSDSCGQMRCNPPVPQKRVY